MPNRVATDAASSAAPDSAETTRLRRPSSAPGHPGGGQHPAGAQQPTRPCRAVGLAEQPEPGLHPVRAAQLQGRAGHRHPAGRPGLRAAARRAARTPAPLASALPAKMTGSSGYASCHDGTAVSASSTPVYVASAGAVAAATSPAACPTGGSSRPAEPEQAPARQQRAASAIAATPAAGPNAREDPGAHRHRRGRLRHPQHVVEPRRPAQVVDQEVGAGADRGQRGDPAGAAQRRPAGELPAGGQQRRPGGQPAGEQVRRRCPTVHTGALRTGRP